VVGRAQKRLALLVDRHTRLLLILEDRIEHHSGRIAVRVIWSVAIDVEPERGAGGHMMAAGPVDHDLGETVARLRNTRPCRANDRKAVEPQARYPLRRYHHIDIV